MAYNYELDAFRSLRKSLRERGPLYFAVGISGGTIELVLFLILYRITAWVMLSNAIAMSCSMTYIFTLNRKYTFKANNSLLLSAGMFVLLFGFNMVFTSWVVKVLIVRLQVYSFVAKAIAMIMVGIWNFPLYTNVIFIRK